MNTDFWTNKALEAIGSLKNGDTFVLKDLFGGIEWNKLSKGDKLYLGKHFKRKAQRGDFPHVCFDETSKGTARYVYKK